MRTSMLRWANSTHPDGGYVQSQNGWELAHRSHFCQLLSTLRNAPTYNGHLTKCSRTPKVIIALHELLGFSKMNPQAIILWKIKIGK